MLTELPLIPIVSPDAPDSLSKGTSPARIRDAAQQFEALLLTQILHAAREGGAGWLGSGEDSSGDCATDFAEQRFAAILAQQGGFGLAEMIASGVDHDLGQGSAGELSSGPFPKSSTPAKRPR